MTNQTKTIEQLREELRVAEQQEAERVAEEKRKKREQEEAVRAEERRRQHAAFVAGAQRLLAPIKLALEAEGIVTQLDGLKLDVMRGEHRSVDASMVVYAEERKVSSWRHERTGRYELSIGESHRDQPRVRFPQLASGQFNVEKIVARVKERLEFVAAKHRAQDETERRLREAKNNAAAVITKLGGCSLIEGSYDQWLPVGAGPRHERRVYVARPGHVYVNLSRRELTVDHAVALVEAIRAVDAKFSKKEA